MLCEMWDIHFFFSLQIYCCLGALAIADSLHHVNADMLGWWLCERQLPSGGLNGELERVTRIPKCQIGHFCVAFCLCVKTRLSAKLFKTYENVFHQHVHLNANQTHFHIKSFARGLFLEQRQKGTWKWPILKGFFEGLLWRHNGLMQVLSTLDLRDLGG